jgi:protein MpaA
LELKSKFILVVIAIATLLFGCNSPQKESAEEASSQLSEEQIAQIAALERAQEVEQIKPFCDKVNAQFKSFNWHSILCIPERWKSFGVTKDGYPLLYQEFGFAENKSGPVNLFLCGVHGDEPPGVYLCFHLVRELLFDNPKSFEGFRIVIAPIVNPEGFFAGTRTNSNGIDPNRNLPTRDFKKRALKVWKRYKNAKNKYPGKVANSEIESQFQVHLIKEYQPDKIVSVHAPYGFLDYDGPGDRKYYNLVRVEQRAKYLALNMQANSKDFLKVVDFRFFPGSLGNYAGNERKIPTYTLELPSTSVKKAPYYWNALRFALVKAMAFRVYDGKEGNPFFRVRNLLDQQEQTLEETTRQLSSSEDSPTPSHPEVH